jgi:hypothetical protein
MVFSATVALRRMKLLRHPVTLGVLLEAALVCLFFMFPSPAFGRGIQYDVVLLHFPGLLAAKVLFGPLGDGDFYVAAALMTGVWISAFYALRRLVRFCAARQKQ